MRGTLSEFLNLLEIRGRIWCFVEIRGSGSFSVLPNDGVVFHTVLRGNVRVASVTEGIVELNAGDVRIFLSGEVHAVRTHTNGSAPTLEFLRDDNHDIDSPPTFTIGAGPIKARLLCGRLKSDGVVGLRHPAVPGVIALDAANTGREISALRVQTLEKYAVGWGASALLTRVAQATLTVGLRDHSACPLLFRQCTAQDPIMRAMELIERNPSTCWSVASLANRVGMRRSSFAARFMSQAGRTPMAVVAEVRMQYAAELLNSSDLKIAEISRRSGYRSEAAFTRRFTCVFGIPPKQMRQAQG